jgi:hypothetical protein
MNIVSNSNNFVHLFLCFVYIPNEEAPDAKICEIAKKAAAMWKEEQPQIKKFLQSVYKADLNCYCRKKVANRNIKARTSMWMRTTTTYELVISRCKICAMTL